VRGLKYKNVAAELLENLLKNELKVRSKKNLGHGVRALRHKQPAFACLPWWGGCMLRSPRLEFEGAFYHVMCRGNRREAVFLDAEDHELFLKRLGEACDLAGFRICGRLGLGHRSNLARATRRFENGADADVRRSK